MEKARAVGGRGSLALKLSGRLRQPTAGAPDGSRERVNEPSSAATARAPVGVGADLFPADLVHIGRMGSWVCALVKRGIVCKRGPAPLWWLSPCCVQDFTILANDAARCGSSLSSSGS
jgi:hypothetical protein